MGKILVYGFLLRGDLTSLADVIDAESTDLSTITPEVLTLVITGASIQTSTCHLTPVSFWVASDTYRQGKI